MREAVGSALLLNIVLVFVGIISMILVGSIAYSKAYKVKNRIIAIIDKYDGDCFEDFSNPKPYGKCFEEIEEELANMGYSSNISADINEKCPSENRIYPKVNDNNVGHKYCVYKYVLCDKTTDELGNSVCSLNSNNVTHYYKVITFMHFDIPVIGSFLEFPVSGESKQFYDSFVNAIE